MSHKAAADGADVPWTSKQNEGKERRMAESGSAQRQASRNRQVTVHDMVTGACGASQTPGESAAESTRWEDGQGARRETVSDNMQRRARKSLHQTVYDMVTRNRQERYANKRGQVQTREGDQGVTNLRAEQDRS